MRIARCNLTTQRKIAMVITNVALFTIGFVCAVLYSMQQNLPRPVDELTRLERVVGAQFSAAQSKAIVSEIASMQRRVIKTNQKVYFCLGLAFFLFVGTAVLRELLMRRRGNQNQKVNAYNRTAREKKERFHAHKVSEGRRWQEIKDEGSAH